MSAAAASRTPSGDLIALPGYLPFNPGSAIPFGGPQNLAQFYQDQTWTLGDHSIRFGGSYVRIQDDRTFGAYQNAVEQLGSSLSSGLDNFVRGQFLNFSVAIDPQGEVFNPELHEAMVTQPSNEHVPNTVLQVIQRGYQLNGRLLRPARVIVAREH